MNLQRVKKLRAFVAELPPKACDMQQWLTTALDKKTGVEITPQEMKAKRFSCGTVGCLGGWTMIVIQLDRSLTKRHKAVGLAHRYLGLTAVQRHRLFNGFPVTGNAWSGRKWKKWMLGRLSDVISKKRIDPAKDSYA